MNNDNIFNTLSSYFFQILLVLLTLILLTRLYLKHSIKRCVSKTSMEGKVIIVTGANTGIGYHTAENLAARGGKVILACRNEKRGLEARDKIISATGNNNVEYKQLNLSSLDSVRKFVMNVTETERKIDVLINNAGVHGLQDRYTEDGIVEGMQINHFAPFLLTLLLLPTIKKSQGRIVIVSSICHFRGEIKFDRINKAGYYSDTITYANGKLCNILFSVELAQRLEGTGVTVNAVHPGVILTNIVSDESKFTKLMFAVWCWICCRTPEEGAQTPIYLAVAEEVQNMSGEFFIDCEKAFVTWKVRDKTLRKKLWEFSEKLVGYSEQNVKENGL